MAEEYSRKAVFEILGQEVPDKEMQRAESYADRKLERATEMQPEDAATYRSGWYRVLLVADLVKQLAFQDFTLAPLRAEKLRTKRRHTDQCKHMRI